MIDDNNERETKSISHGSGRFEDNGLGYWVLYEAIVREEDYSVKDAIKRGDGGEPPSNIL